MLRDLAEYIVVDVKTGIGIGLGIILITLYGYYLRSIILKMSPENAFKIFNVRMTSFKITSMIAVIIGFCSGLSAILISLVKYFADLWNPH